MLFLKSMAKKNLRVVDEAPDFTLLKYNDGSVRLKDILNGGEKVLLVFLRHLG